jgi:hypothetical protein
MLEEMRSRVRGLVWLAVVATRVAWAQAGAWVDEMERRGRSAWPSERSVTPLARVNRLPLKPG